MLLRMFDSRWLYQSYRGLLFLLIEYLRWKCFCMVKQDIHKLFHNTNDLASIADARSAQVALLPVSRLSLERTPFWWEVS